MANSDSALSERRLWRVDLNDIEVIDERGVMYNVIAARGVLDGTLAVTIRSEDVPLRVAERLADALEQALEADR